MLKRMFHKRNELQEVEFFEDIECKVPFDFKDAKDLYIELKDGDVTPLLCINKTKIETIFTPYLPCNTSLQCHFQKLQKNENTMWLGKLPNIQTLDDITPNLSKYIPEDNAVLFLSEDLISGKLESVRDDLNLYFTINGNGGFTRFENNRRTSIFNVKTFKTHINNKATIFLPYGTQSELEKAKEVAKELKEKYGVEEVNLCVLNWFLYATTESAARKLLIQKLGFNKIITTNSTGILEPQNTERLQVIDCFDIFNDYLKSL